MPGTDKRIAVIAVHGVGDQAPFETAHRIGDLLQSLNAGEPAAASPAEDSPPQSESPAYYPFHEDTIRLDVRPTVVHPDGDVWQDSGIRGPFDAWVKRTFRRKASVSDDEIWYQFTRGQLAGYHREDPENTYETVRMEGERAPSQDHPGCAVHVYELYWADLSRLKAGVLSSFTELYQLLFHLPSLGTHTVNASASHHSRSSFWRIYK